MHTDVLLAIVFILHVHFSREKMDKILGTEEDLLKIVDRPSEVSTKCVGICTGTRMRLPR